MRAAGVFIRETQNVPNVSKQDQTEIFPKHIYGPMSTEYNTNEIF